MSAKPRIYVSALATTVSAPDPLVEAATLLATLKERCSLYIPLEWRDYATIEKEIDECAALLALVDTYWMSSTWKASELTWANDGHGARHADNEHVRIPVFVAHLDGCHLGFLRGVNGLVFLPADAEIAAGLVFGAVGLEATSRSSPR